MDNYNHQKIDPEPEQSSVQAREKMANRYDHQAVERKWQEIWDKLELYRARDFDKREKAYILIEFPYLSGDGLHVGHSRSYSALDAIARKKRMQGYNVLYPIGWDAFGLPTENYAIKTGTHPIEITKKNVALFKRQLKSLGFSFDWSREINTSDPKYYKWTQWIFLKMFEKGLAYLAEIPINWCPECKIGLANEEVISGDCERCGKEVERRQQKQWMLKITAYADRLLKDLDTVDYLEKIKAQQINWIGKSHGVTIKFKIAVPNPQSPIPNPHIEVFTTRTDTLFGVTALVLAPEHELVKKITTPEYQKKVKEYIKASQKKSEFERIELEKEKTGVFIGTYAINPANQEKVPVWIGDYVVATYGGGAVMLVPAHDKRDYVFAKKYGLEIREVVKPAAKTPDVKSCGGRASAPIGSGDTLRGPTSHLGTSGVKSKPEQAYIDYGILINSGKFNGLGSKQAIKKIGKWLERHKKGEQRVQYKLRDWVFSRQHYWGEPIPLVFCTSCKKRAEDLRFKIKDLRTLQTPGVKSAIPKQTPGVNLDSKNQKSKIKNFNKGELLNPGWIAVPEKNLPVELPYVKSYKPTQTGESPLANIDKWVNTSCPKCGWKAKRETDTMPNWAGSNWYYLAYIIQGNSKFEIRNLKLYKYWLPVDLYNGGMEHTTLHLLYSRFWHKFLYDIGVVPTKEPYKKRRSHGIVLAEDGRKMSKSFGNVINPDDIVNTFGADAFRVYEMFMGPFDQAISWDTKTILGVSRFLDKVRSLVVSFKQTPGVKSAISKQTPGVSPGSINQQGLEILKHQTIKKVSEDLDNMKFNTAIATLMEYTNAIFNSQFSISKQYIETLLLLLAPFAPHLAEELWQLIKTRINTDQQRGHISVNPRSNQRKSSLKSIFEEKWPQHDPKLAKSKKIELVIQINGKVRDKVVVNADISQKQAEKVALKQKKIQTYVKGNKIKKVIFVKGKLINLVID